MQDNIHIEMLNRVYLERNQPPVEDRSLCASAVVCLGASVVEGVSSIA